MKFIFLILAVSVQAYSQDQFIINSSRTNPLIELKANETTCGKVIKIIANYSAFDRAPYIVLDNDGVKKTYRVGVNASTMQILTTAFSTDSKLCVTFFKNTVGIHDFIYSIEKD